MLEYCVASDIFSKEAAILTHHPYGHLVRVLHACADQVITEALSEMELTAAQGHLMGYLALRKTPPCSRDIEEDFQLSHPTVSGLLSRLEKKGFIEFVPDETDRRCKRIHISPKGQAYNEAMYRKLQENEAKMVQGFSAEEQEQFEILLQRAISNMGGNPCRRNHKEEQEQ